MDHVFLLKLRKTQRLYRKQQEREDCVKAKGYIEQTTARAVSDTTIWYVILLLFSSWFFFFQSSRLQVISWEFRFILVSELFDGEV